MKLTKLSFFTETGKVIEGVNNDINSEGYVVLATIQSEPKIREFENNFILTDITIAKKFLRNQVQSSKKEYHYGTTGHIYGFGYSPVYSSNAETQYTIDRFAKSKYNLRLISFPLFCILSNN